MRKALLILLALMPLATIAADSASASAAQGSDDKGTGIQDKRKKLELQRRRFGQMKPDFERTPGLKAQCLFYNFTAGSDDAAEKLLAQEIPSDTKERALYDAGLDRLLSELETNLCELAQQVDAFYNPPAGSGGDGGGCGMGDGYGVDDW